MNWCILIPLLVGLISALLGYLLGRLFRGGNDDSDRIAKLEADLEACKNSRTSLEADLKSANADLAAALASGPKIESSSIAQRDLSDFDLVLNFFHRTDFESFSGARAVSKTYLASFSFTEYGPVIRQSRM